MLAITTYATKSYTKAMPRLAERLLACIRYDELPFENVSIILAGDDSEEVVEAWKPFVEMATATGMKQKRLALPGLTDNGNGQHQKTSNLVIAKMMAAAWHEARCQNVDMLWSVESDTLPQAKTLRVLKDTLRFDKGWYDVAMATYPNNEFLGGRGTPQNWILPSVRVDERILSKAVERKVKQKEERIAQLNKAQQQPTEEDRKAWQALEKEIEECPPKGNVYALNAVKWRKRGWLSSAYPAVGQGATLPTDWVGTGCTLMSRRALDTADFTGYEGGCTQDLWLCWRAWAPEGIRMAVSTHALCSHVKPLPSIPGQPDSEKVLKILHARHEMGGEAHGHLRSDERPWDFV